LVSRYQNVSILDFIGAKNDEGGGGNNWSYKKCNAPFKMSTTITQFLQAGCPGPILKALIVVESMMCCSRVPLVNDMFRKRNGALTLDYICTSWSWLCDLWFCVGIQGNHTVKTVTDGNFTFQILC